MGGKSNRILVAIVAAISLPAVAQTAPPGYHIATLGLMGSEYQQNYGKGQTYRNDELLQVNSSGEVVGFTERYGGINNAGRDCWIYDGSTTHLIGLTGPAYECPVVNVPTLTQRTMYASALNDSGQVAGSTDRVSADRTSLGSDAWFYDGSTTIQIGFFGPGYEFQMGTEGVYRVSDALSVNDSGQIIGYSERYNSSGTYLGMDGWLMSNGTTVALGLSGTDYESPISGGDSMQFSSPESQNNAGDVVGTSERLSASGANLGEDTWFYNGSTTVQIGLTGPDYEYTELDSNNEVIGVYRDSAPPVAHFPEHYLSENGIVAGISSRYAANGASEGTDAWVYDGQSTKMVSLTGARYGTVDRESQITMMSKGGSVIGYTFVTGGTGKDTWVYSGGKTHLAGLTGGKYEKTISNLIYSSDTGQAVNDAGESIGESAIEDTTSGFEGSDAWFDDGTSARRIGLSGGFYQYTDTAHNNALFRSGGALSINQAGQVIGESSRYTSTGASLGQGGWFFDPATDLTTELLFSTRSSDQYANIDPTYLSDTGAVVGSYELYNGSTDVGGRAFWWSLSGGFHDLGAMVDGGLTTAGWQYLAGFDINNTADRSLNGTVGDGAPKYAIGFGVLTGQLDGTASAFLLTADAPEPSSAAGCGLVFFICCLASRARQVLSPKLAH